MGLSSGGASAASLNTFLGLMSGHAIVRSIAVIAELGVPDQLARGPKTATELARAVGADPDALQRLMHALAGIGLFSETRESGLFGLTALSEPLRSDSPHSLRDFVRLRGGEPYWSAWGALDKALRTGRAAFEHAHGTSHFEYLNQRRDVARRFDDGMRALSRQIDAAIVSGYDFSRFGRVMDVGGGQGGLLAAILRANPHLHGILLDLAPAIEKSGEVLRSADVSHRCETWIHDFFAPLPARADAIILSRILHNWGDEDALRILRNCRASLPDTGKLLIVEYVMTDDAPGLAAKLFDLQMLVYFGQGRERSPDQYRSLLGRTDFTLTRILTTPLAMCIVEATAI